MQFEVSYDNMELIESFRKKQNKIAKRKDLKSKHGGDLTYCFTSSGIGEIFYVIHNATGEKLDLTDVGSW